MNRIQNIRKDSGLEVTDRIHITKQSHKEIDEAIASNEKYIKDETLADDLTVIQTVNNGTIVEFDDIATSIQVKKI